MQVSWCTFALISPVEWWYIMFIWKSVHSIFFSRDKSFQQMLCIVLMLLAYGLICRDSLKQRLPLTFLGSHYLNDTHQIWTLGPSYVALRHAYWSAHSLAWVYIFRSFFLVAILLRCNKPCTCTELPPCHGGGQWSFFKIKWNVFFGYFDPKNVNFDNKNKYFSGWPEQYFG